MKVKIPANDKQSSKTRKTTKNFRYIKKEKAVRKQTPIEERIRVNSNLNIYLHNESVRDKIRELSCSPSNSIKES